MAQSICDLKNSSPALIILGLALIIIALLLLFKFLDPTTKKIVEALDNTVNVVGTARGTWGGSCTCPDGQVYQVGDNGDACASLACHGGVPGTCNRHGGPWSNKSVTCATAKDPNRLIDFTNADPNIHATVVVDPSVPLPIKPLPTKEGCWLIYPSGCDNKGWKRHSWMQDTWGEEHAGTGNSSSACATRQDAIIKLCGNQDIKTHFVPTTGWQKCATEHGTCTGKGIVKFCSERDKTKCSNWKTISGSVKCEHGIFGDPDVGSTKDCYIKGSLAGTDTVTPAPSSPAPSSPAPTSSNTPPSSWISHDGNCKAAVINTYPTMKDALDSCECDDSCQAVYHGTDGRWSSRKSCCDLKPRPGYCTDDNKCTTGISCNTQQGGTTYIKPGSTPAPTNPNIAGNWKAPLGIVKITQKPDGTLAATGVNFKFAVTGKFNADNPLITTWNFSAYGAPILEGILKHSVLPTVDQKTKLNQINWSNGAVWTKQPISSGKCVPNVVALTFAGNPNLDIMANLNCKNITSKAACGPLGAGCPACCMWQA